MGFKDARKQAIDALLSGHVSHEARNDIDDKNLLLSGEVTVADVVKLLNRCKGTQHTSSKHHLDAQVEVHVFKPVEPGVMGEGPTRWYIKLYFMEPDVWFISVHKS